MIRSCWYWKAYLAFTSKNKILSPNHLKKWLPKDMAYQNCHQQAILGLSKSHPTRPSGYPSDFEPWAQLATQWAPGRLAVECPVVSRICSFEGLHWWISMDGMGWDKMKLPFVLFRKKPRGLFSTELWLWHIFWLWEEGYFVGLVTGETGPFGGALNSWEAAGGVFFCTGYVADDPPGQDWAVFLE